MMQGLEEKTINVLYMNVHCNTCKRKKGKIQQSDASVPFGYVQSIYGEMGN